MALDDDIGILERVAIFQDFDRDQLRLLAFGAERLKLATGRELYREGALADCAFVLVSGNILLFRERNKERTTLARVAPGALLGEMALLAGARRLTGAVAESDCSLMRLNRSQFRRILEEYPDKAAALHRRIAGNLTSMIERIEKLAPKFS